MGQGIETGGGTSSSYKGLTGVMLLVYFYF